MGPTFLAFLIISTFISTLIGGIIFISLGYRFNRKLSLIRTGWIIIGALSILTTLAIVYYAMMTGWLIFSIIFLGPIIVIAGLIATLVLGISNLAIGFRTPRNVQRIANGFILLGINLAIITTFVVLLVMFATGIIPIRLM